MSQLMSSINILHTISVQNIDAGDIGVPYIDAGESGDSCTARLTSIYKAVLIQNVYRSAICYNVW